MASQTLAEISRSDLAGLPGPSRACITGLEHLASYSWVEKSAPTISVPGFAALWSPPSVPPKMQPDSGVVFIDENAARNPHSPLEPLFRALYAGNLNLDIGDVDLITDRNNIRKLLRFVQGSSSDAFQIEVEIAGAKTVLFTRVEDKTTEVIQGFKGYGRNFEKVYTQKQTGSTGYYRIVTYKFGDMKCVVRHETDGYVGDSKAKSASASEAVGGPDSLLDAVMGLSISTPKDIAGNEPATKVQTGGKVVDLSSTLEIKTRAASRTLDMAEVTSQLWISQTPNLAVGYHRNGVFKDVRLRDMKGDVGRWEAANQAALANLARLIKEIAAVVMRSDARRAVVKYDGGANIKIVVGEQKRALPEDLYSKWEKREKTEASTAAQDRGGKGVSGRDDKAPSTSTSSVPADIPFSEIIDEATRKGFRQLFRRMPTRLSDYRVLCASLKTAAVDVLGGRTLRNIMADMRSGKSEYDPYEERTVCGLKSLARDSAFRLMYMLVLGEPQPDASDRNTAYNAALFVVSHRAIFMYRTRKMVREAFEARFPVSDKQRRALNEWPLNSAEEGETDATTPEEGYVSDSDGYGWFSGYSS